MYIYVSPLVCALIEPMRTEITRMPDLMCIHEAACNSKMKKPPVSAGGFQSLYMGCALELVGQGVYHPPDDLHHLLIGKNQMVVMCPRSVVYRNGTIICNVMFHIYDL